MKQYWTDYPEIIKKHRTKKESVLAEETIKLYNKFRVYLLKDEYKDLIHDLVGGIHLLQTILITIQKRRVNKKK